MSISTDAMLIVGCKYKELAAVLGEDQIEQLNEYLYMIMVYFLYI